MFTLRSLNLMMYSSFWIWLPRLQLRFPKLTWTMSTLQEPVMELLWLISCWSTLELTDLSKGVNIWIFLFWVRSFYSRAFPMVSSLIGPQYNNDQFWKFSTSAASGSPNNFDTPMVPTFSSDFEVTIPLILSYIILQNIILVCPLPWNQWWIDSIWGTKPWPCSPQ